MTRILIIIASICLVATAAATIPDIDLCDASMPNSGHLWVKPGEGGPPLTQIYSGWTGDLVDGTITVTVVNSAGDPLVSYPGEDIWLASSGDVFAFCYGTTSADQSTDAMGQTTITGPMRAGGQIPAHEEARVMIAGLTAANMVVPLTINSPDVNGDLVVDLSDITRMALAFANYDWRLDFNNDGTMNLYDIAIFTAAIGGGCD